MKDDLDERIRTLEAEVPLWQRINEPADADRNIWQRNAVRLWNAGLPQFLVGVLITVALVGILPSSGFTLVSVADAHLARTVRAHLPRAHEMSNTDLLARTKASDRAVRFVVQLAQEPTPENTLSFLGRLSFQNPPLVRGDRIAALEDTVRLLGSLPESERHTRLDWLVSIAADTANPHSGLANAIEALSRLPLAIRHQLLLGDAAALKSVVRLLLERSTSMNVLAATERDLTEETERLNRENARARSAIQDVRKRRAATTDIGPACAADWQRFEACTSRILAPRGPLPSTDKK